MNSALSGPRVNEYGNAVIVTPKDGEPTWEDFETLASVLTYNVKATERELARAKDIPFGFYEFDSVEFYCWINEEAQTIACWHAWGA